MTLDSEVTETGKIENIPRRGINVSRGIFISSLAHILAIYAALGFPGISFFSSRSSLKGHE